MAIYIFDISVSPILKLSQELVSPRITISFARMLLLSFSRNLDTYRVKMFTVKITICVLPHSTGTGGSDCVRKLMEDSSRRE